MQVHDNARVLARCSFSKTHLQTAGGGSWQSSLHDFNRCKKCYSIKHLHVYILTNCMQFECVSLLTLGVFGPVSAVRAIFTYLSRLQQHLLIRRRLCVCSRFFTGWALPPQTSQQQWGHTNINTPIKSSGLVPWGSALRPSADWRSVAHKTLGSHDEAASNFQLFGRLCSTAPPFLPNHYSAFWKENIPIFVFGQFCFPLRYTVKKGETIPCLPKCKRWRGKMNKHCLLRNSNSIILSDMWILSVLKESMPTGRFFTAISDWSEN